MGLPFEEIVGVSFTHICYFILNTVYHRCVFYTVNTCSCMAKCRTDVDDNSVKLHGDHNHGANTGVAPHKVVTPTRPAKSPKPTKSTPTKQPTRGGLMRPVSKSARPVAKPTGKTPTKSSKSTTKSASKTPPKSPKPKETTVQQAVPTTLVLIKQEQHDENHLFL